MTHIYTFDPWVYRTYILYNIYILPQGLRKSIEVTYSIYNVNYNFYKYL